MRIYKYPLNATFAPQKVQMPASHRILAFQMQDDTPTIWAEVNTMSGITDVDIILAANGQEVPSHNYGYHGTVQGSDGPVYHLYIKS